MAGFRGVKINTAQVEHLLRARGGPVDKVLEKTAKRVRDKAEQYAPRGKKVSPLNPAPISQSIVVNRAGGINPRWQVGSRQGEKLGYIRSGTAPHRIYASKKNALVFRWERIGGVLTVVPASGGRSYFNKGRGILFIGKGYVDHPGTTPNDFLRRAFDEVRREGI